MVFTTVVKIRLFLPEKIFLEIINFFYKSVGFTKYCQKTREEISVIFTLCYYIIFEDLHVTKPGMPTSQSLQ